MTQNSPEELEDQNHCSSEAERSNTLLYPGIALGTSLVEEGHQRWGHSLLLASRLVRKSNSLSSQKRLPARFVCVPLVAYSLPLYKREWNQKAVYRSVIRNVIYSEHG